MPAYNFQTRFALKVARRRKRQTIRARRKNRPCIGQMAHCFTGMRTKKCRCLGRWPIIHVKNVCILEEGVILDGKALRSIYLNQFAVLDGFHNWDSMKNFFQANHGLPFQGDLIIWE